MMMVLASLLQMLPTRKERQIVVAGNKKRIELTKRTS